MFDNKNSGIKLPAILTDNITALGAKMISDFLLRVNTPLIPNVVFISP